MVDIGDLIVTIMYLLLPTKRTPYTPIYLLCPLHFLCTSLAFMFCKLQADIERSRLFFDTFDRILVLGPLNFITSEEIVNEVCIRYYILVLSGGK